MGKRYFTVIKKVTQKYIYRVEAENKGEALDLVKDGKAGEAKHTKQGDTAYEVD